MARKIIYDEEEEEDELQESSDMQMSEDEGDEGAQSNVGDDEVDPQEEEELSEKEDELEEEDGSDIDELSPPPSDIAEEETTTQPRLKIKLKLPTQSATNNSTPGPSTTSRTTSRRAPARARTNTEDIDIESEDPESEEDVDSTRSNSVANLPNRALTARQAALANVAETSHVSLVEPPNPRKKKPLTEDEIALKREETARKRKNLTEKKLEDEKAETINRLLKKQSRGKGRRNALASAEDKATPLASVTNAQDDEEAVEGSEPPAIVLPTMYRWVSSVKTETNTEGEIVKTMALSFSIPTTVIPVPSQDGSPGEAAPMEVDGQPPVPPPTKPVHLCDVPGCQVPRKYRLVKDWQRGACGMAHLKTLEAQLGTVS